MSSDPSIDPALVRQNTNATPTSVDVGTTAVGTAPAPTAADHSRPHPLRQPQGVPSNDIFNAAAYDGTPANPHLYEMAAAAVESAVMASNVADKQQQEQQEQQQPRALKAKRIGPLIRKRSGWNAFYKEQFAIYHANNPPKSKQNARERKGFSSYAADLWKQLSTAQKEEYVQRAGEDDALAVSRPVEKLRRKRTGLLDTLGRIV